MGLSVLSVLLGLVFPTFFFSSLVIVHMVCTSLVNVSLRCQWRGTNAGRRPDRSPILSVALYREPRNKAFPLPSF